MNVTLAKRSLQTLIEEEINAWYQIAGGPNPDAFDFNPRTTSPEQLRELGYYDNKDAWIAGVRVQALQRFLADLG